MNGRQPWFNRLKHREKREKKEEVGERRKYKIGERKKKKKKTRSKIQTKSGEWKKRRNQW